MTDNLFWVNRIVESSAADPQELAKGYNPDNWRFHPQIQRDALEDALDSIGVLQPVLFNRLSGKVIDGHLRIELAILKGQPLIPVNYVELTDDEEALALATLDAITEQAEPIPDKLAALLLRTRAMTADRPGLGAMLAALRERAGINGNGSAPPEPPPMVDRAEELQAKWKVSLGDLFEFPSLTTPGRFHRLLCGDCREPTDLMRLTDGQQVNGVFTSPPYAEQRKQQYGGVPVGEYVEWWGAVQTNVRSVLVRDGSFFVNIKPHTDEGQRVLYVFDLVLAMVRQWGWRLIEEFCWLRNPTPKQVIEHFKQGFEPVYQFAIDKFKFNPQDVRHASESVPIPGGEGTGNTNWSGRQGNEWALKNIKGLEQGMAYPSTVLDFAKSGGLVDGHSAAFPVALPTFFLKAYSDPGDIWLDPFAGSGTVGVAAENEGRVAYMIEKLPKYVSVICERLETMGLTPKRQ